jgi:hypothetical protein
LGARLAAPFFFGAVLVVTEEVAMRLTSEILRFAQDDNDSRHDDGR